MQQIVNQKSKKTKLLTIKLGIEKAQFFNKFQHLRSNSA